jgi:hypothetical protein
MARRSFIFISALAFLASMAGCGVRTSNMAAPARSASHADEHRSARREPTAKDESKRETSSPEGEKRYDTPTIVIGFVGGFVRHSDSVHSPVQVASRIRGAYPSGVYVEVFENRRREEAHRKILEILGKARDGKLSDSAKQKSRVIIYGMSWGGSETVALARELKDDKIPVLLTVQVDSVAKVGQNDEVIPANVAEAVNFYQSDGLLHGRAQIRAADANRTRILGNFRYEYKKKALACGQYPWYDRLFTKYHTEIECDPEVWNRVEMLIREKLPPAEEKVAQKNAEPQH